MGTLLRVDRVEGISLLVSAHHEDNIIASDTAAGAACSGRLAKLVEGRPLPTAVVVVAALSSGLTALTLLQGVEPYLGRSPRYWVAALTGRDAESREQAVRMLTLMLEDDDPSTRSWAAYVLKSCGRGGPEASAVL